jgi:hypothetical protein
MRLLHKGLKYYVMEEIPFYCALIGNLILFISLLGI